jgi:hypothetical protein
MVRDDLGRFVPGNSANPGGRPGVPEVIKATLCELVPARGGEIGPVAGQHGRAHPA